MSCRRISFFLCIFVALVTASAYTDPDSNSESSTVEPNQDDKVTPRLDLCALLDVPDGAMVTLVADDTLPGDHDARSPVLVAISRCGAPEASSGNATRPGVKLPHQQLAYMFGLQAPQQLRAANKLQMAVLKTEGTPGTAVDAAMLEVWQSVVSLRQALRALMRAYSEQGAAPEGRAGVVQNPRKPAVPVSPQPPEPPAETSSPAPGLSSSDSPTTPPDGQSDVTAEGLTAPHSSSVPDGVPTSRLWWLVVPGTGSATHSAQPTAGRGHTPITAAPSAADHSQSTLANMLVTPQRSPAAEVSSAVPSTQRQDATSREGWPSTNAEPLMTRTATPPPSGALASRLHVAPTGVSWTSAATQTHIGTSPTTQLDSRSSSTTQPHSDQSSTPASAAQLTALRHTTPPDDTTTSGLRNSAEEKGMKLLQAAYEDAVGELRSLLADGADVEARNDWGWTALHWAAQRGHVAAARCLLAAGAEVGAKDRQHWTPLHAAASWGHTAVVRLLLAHSADPNARDEDLWTPLHFAAYNGRAEAAKVLLEAGADREATDSMGRTPIDHARTWNYYKVIDILS